MICWPVLTCHVWWLPIHIWTYFELVCFNDLFIFHFWTKRFCDFDDIHAFLTINGLCGLHYFDHMKYYMDHETFISFITLAIWPFMPLMVYMTCKTNMKIQCIVQMIKDCAIKDLEVSIQHKVERLCLNIVLFTTYLGRPYTSNNNSVNYKWAIIFEYLEVRLFNFFEI